MGLGTCVIQNGVRFPICVARARLRSSSHTPSKCFPSSSSAQAYSSLSPLTADHRLPLFCTKRTDNEDELSAESEKENSAQPHDDITNIDTSITQKSHQRQTYTVALWVCTAVAFGVGLGFKDGAGKATEFFAGYILEQSLSVDNLFVFVLIFKYFKVPIMYQNRVLSYGIAGAVFFRLTLILLGTATLQRFEAVNLLLAAILLYSSFKHIMMGIGS